MSVICFLFLSFFCSSKLLPLPGPLCPPRIPETSEVQRNTTSKSLRPGGDLGIMGCGCRRRGQPTTLCNAEKRLGGHVNSETQMQKRHHDDTPVPRLASPRLLEDNIFLRSTSREGIEIARREERLRRRRMGGLGWPNGRVLMTDDDGQTTMRGRLPSSCSERCSCLSMSQSSNNQHPCPNRRRRRTSPKTR
ncbi:hypothetical protein SCHPADRAFT_910573 [Schizopora paradoxa]|uniref:Secreted protein n=1 Tax=Schizopora paradoxa TaxID=27342 RepID=A0A0H2R2U9_9AGAM|nr:hypothetical protein SCHPADRAFT_910573 [Schizopora paradoxa]